jgi:hypothetical protein
MRMTWIKPEEIVYVVGLDERFLTFWLLRTPTESLLEAADPEVISTIWTSKQYTKNTQIKKYFI